MIYLIMEKAILEQKLKILESDLYIEPSFVDVKTVRERRWPKSHTAIVE